MITFKSNIDSIAKAIANLAPGTLSAMQAGMILGMRQFERKIIKEYFSGRKSDLVGLRRRTGTAANSWDVSTSGGRSDFAVKLRHSESAWYIAVHQHKNFDGYIRPKNAQALAIPLKKSLYGKSPKNFPGLVPLTRRNGKTVLARVRGVNSKGKLTEVEPMYVLVKQVYIPKRLYIIEDFYVNAPKIIKTFIYRQVDKDIVKGRIKP